MREITEIELPEIEAIKIRVLFKAELKALKLKYDLSKGTQSVKTGYKNGIILIWSKYSAIVKAKVIEIISKEA